MRKRIQTGSEAEAAFNAAVVAQNQGELALAREEYVRLADEYPDDARIVGKLGFVEYELHEYDAARRRFEQACRLAPSVELWSVGLFHSLWKLGETDVAFDEIRRFLRIDPDAPEYRRLISEMHAEFVEKGWVKPRD